MDYFYKHERNAPLRLPFNFTNMYFINCKFDNMKFIFRREFCRFVNLL